MFPKYIPKYIRMPTGIRREFRTYEIEILNILISKQMYKFKNKCIQLFRVLPDNSLVSIRREIKKKINLPDKIEDILNTYFNKYKIEEPVKRKYLRKKEDSDLVKLRVDKFRANTKKVSLQVLLKPDFKAKFDKRKNDLNLTTEQFIIKLFYDSF
jgi:hypothetical protein